MLALQKIIKKRLSHITIFFLFLLFVFFLISRPANAFIEKSNYEAIQNFNKVCKKNKQYVNISSPDVLNFSLSQNMGVKELTQRYSPHADKYSAPQALTWGITEAEFKLSTNYKISSYESKVLGVACAIPGIELDIGFSNFEVRLANELSSSRCVFNYVLSHEKEHVQVYRLGVREMTKSLNDKFQEQLKDKVFVADTLQIAVANAREYMESFVDTFVAQEIQKIRNSNLKLDTPENYAKGAHACDDGILKLQKTL